ncbi:MAG: MaoC family dehydratase [Acidobacteriia bacterium]|nr:MaoC family dehydratase [Terriglobia bacterium]
MRYLEDLQVGDRFTAASAEVSARDILNFADRFDPQPMHLDEAAAAGGPLNGLSASGWHTTALVMRLTVDAKPLGGGPVLGLGVDEIRWPNPVRPGDTLTAELEVVSITPSRSKPSHGVVRLRTTARNQRGEVVLTMFPNLWVPRRAVASAG